MVPTQLRALIKSRRFSGQNRITASFFINGEQFVGLTDRMAAYVDVFKTNAAFIELGNNGFKKAINRNMFEIAADAKHTACSLESSFYGYSTTMFRPRTNGKTSNYDIEKNGASLAGFSHVVLSHADSTLILGETEKQMKKSIATWGTQRPILEFDESAVGTPEGVNKLDAIIKAAKAAGLTFVGINECLDKPAPIAPKLEATFSHKCVDPKHIALAFEASNPSSAKKVTDAAIIYKSQFSYITNWEFSEKDLKVLRDSRSRGLEILNGKNGRAETIDGYRKQLEMFFVRTRHLIMPTVEPITDYPLLTGYSSVIKSQDLVSLDAKALIATLTSNVDSATIFKVPKTTDPNRTPFRSFITAMKRAGYKFVTVSECLAVPN